LVNRIPMDEKLVFTRRTLRHRQCIKVDWPASDSSVVWTSLFYWLGAADIWDSIVSGISSRCIPQGSIVYTRLVRLDHAHEQTIQHDPLLTNPNPETGWKNEVKSLMRFVFPTGYFVQTSREEITGLYQRYSWDLLMGGPPFLVSRDPLPDWKAQLRPSRFSGWKITKSLLDRIYFVLFNHYDHGFEIVGRSFNPDTLQAVAEEVSRKYDLPLQIQDTGNPFGDP
jgi:hypothetical protein